MGVIMEESVLVTPGEVLGKASEIKAGKGAYYSNSNSISISINDDDDALVYASLTGLTCFIPPSPHSLDKRPTVQITGHKPHGAVPQPGSIVIARVTKVMVRTASADIMCVGPKSVREKFTGIIRQQDVRATEIDKVEMHSSFRPGDIVKAVVAEHNVIVWKVKEEATSPYMHVGGTFDARAYHLSTAKNELGVVSAESASGAAMVPISWTEMQCPLTGQTEPRKVAKVET